MFWAEIWKISEFFIWKFSFFVVKFSVYLNGQVFVMYLNVRSRNPKIIKWEKQPALTDLSSRSCHFFFYIYLNLSLGTAFTAKSHVGSAKTQINLHIIAVWSESSLGILWVAKEAKYLHAASEDSDQTVRMRRLIWLFAGCTGKIVGNALDH